MRQKNVFTLLILLGMMVCIGIPVVGRYLRTDSWKNGTSPLPAYTIATLCSNFDLEEKDPLCSGKNDVYAPDFFATIRETFRPEIEYGLNTAEGITTYEDVESKLGMFKYECEPLTIQTSPKLTYFRCGYDLRGDRVSLIGIYFRSPENTVYRMDTLVGQDD